MKMDDQYYFKWSIKIRYYIIDPINKRRISNRKKVEYIHATKDECLKRLKEFRIPTREIFSYTVLDHFSGLMRFILIE